MMTDNELEKLKVGDSFFAVDTDYIGNLIQYVVVDKDKGMIRFIYYIVRLDGQICQDYWTYYIHGDAYLGWAFKTVEEAWRARIGRTHEW